MDTQNAFAVTKGMAVTVPITARIAMITAIKKIGCVGALKFIVYPLIVRLNASGNKNATPKSSGVPEIRVSTVCKSEQGTLTNARMSAYGT
jgi:hypothetical protein